jgi:hypothetical protein
MEVQAMPQPEDDRDDREDAPEDDGGGSRWRNWTIINTVINGFRLVIEFYEEFLE